MFCTINHNPLLNRSNYNTQKPVYVSPKSTTSKPEARGSFPNYIKNDDSLK